MMTRKDYVLIAAAVKASQQYTNRAPRDCQTSYAHAVDAVAHELANRLQDANANFQRARFMAACGVELFDV